MGKEFKIPISVRQVANPTFPAMPSQNHITIYPYEGHFYFKKADGTVLRMLDTEDIIYKTYAVNGDTSIDIVPAGYKITSIVANGSVNGLELGSSFNGNDIAHDVDINGIEDIPLGKKLFSLTLSQRIYFKGTGWGSTNFHFKMEKIA